MCNVLVIVRVDCIRCACVCLSCKKYKATLLGCLRNSLHHSIVQTTLAYVEHNHKATLLGCLR